MTYYYRTIKIGTSEIQYTVFKDIGDGRAEYVDNMFNEYMAQDLCDRLNRES